MQLVFSSAFTTTLMASCVLIMGHSTTAWAQIPERMHYQGYLTFANGLPVECLDPATCQQPVDLTVRLYSDPLADALLWEEDHLGVVVVGGVVNVPLGENVPITPDLREGPAFLGIEVNGNEEMQPRQELLSTPWALRCMAADDATHLGGIHATDYVTSADADATEDALQSQIATALGQIAELEEKLAALEDVIGQGGSGGGRQNDPDAPLLNDVHTGGDCNAGGGIVTEIPGPDILCRFAAASCPSGWTQLDNWCTTQSTTAGGTFSGQVGSCQQLNQTPTSSTAAGHPFLNQPPSSCCGTNAHGDTDPFWQPVCFQQQKCATTPVVEIGCF